jgi:hypothetical protein
MFNAPFGFIVLTLALMVLVYFLDKETIYDKDKSHLNMLFKIFELFIVTTFFTLILFSIVDKYLYYKFPEFSMTIIHYINPTQNGEMVYLASFLIYVFIKVIRVFRGIDSLYDILK